MSIKMSGLHYIYPTYRDYEPIEEYKSFLVQITTACRNGHPLLVKQLKDLRKKRLRQLRELRDRRKCYKETQHQQRFNDQLHQQQQQRYVVSDDESGVEESDDESNRIQPQRGCKRKIGDSGKKYLYFQKPKDKKKLGRLAMHKTKAIKDTARDMLSDLECIQEQTNIRIDDIAQIYATSNLDVTAHGAEYIRNKEENDHVLKQNDITVIDLDDHKIDTGVEFVGGTALNNTSDSNMVKDLMSKFNEPLRKELAKYVLEKGKSSANRDNDDAKRIYFGFGRVQKTSTYFGGVKMPTFNSFHLKRISKELRNGLAIVLSTGQRCLDKFFEDSGDEIDKDEIRCKHIQDVWRGALPDTLVDWNTIEFVDVNIRSKGDLLRHCDYLNDYRQNHNGCVVFSYSITIDNELFRVVMVMVSRMSVGAAFDKLHKQANH